MIIIANLWGFILLAASGLAGFLLIGATNNVSAGLLVGGLLWLFFGGRRRINRETGLRRPGPTVFFLPLRWWSPIPLALAAIVFPIELAMDKERADPRRPMLDAAVAEVRARTFSGDEDLARALLEHLKTLADEDIDFDTYRIRIEAEPDRALVLIKTSELRTYSENAREQLLGAVHKFATRHLPDREISIGVYGITQIGAIRTPDGLVYAGKYVPESALYPYFGAQTQADRGPAPPRPD